MDRTETGQTTQRSKTDAKHLPNVLTIVGRGVPSNFEVTVEGTLDRVTDDPHDQAGAISGGAAEGAIDVGVTRFRFSGEMTSVRLVDWNGVEAPASASTPTVHVEYGAGR